MKTYAVVGLGYVGLGLAVALGQKNHVFGYDINPERIEELKQGIDRTKQVDSLTLTSSSVTYTDRLDDIKQANFYIVSVATPAYYYETPELDPLVAASEQLATIIKKGDIIVFESTVYPLTTEEICIPIFERVSKLSSGKDFNVGYSPERINPSDKKHTLKSITKIVSAQNKETLAAIADTYATICDHIYPVSNIATAEAIKILENTQRDVNIALMNEFSKIMHALNLDVDEIIEGAKTKWSFVPYKPGFVGGHCISIDPHYLAFQAKRHGVFPELILSARRVNDEMTGFVIQSMLGLSVKNKMDLTKTNLAVLGIAYKENVADIRNSLSLKLIKELQAYNLPCQVHDPLDYATIRVNEAVHLVEFNQLEQMSVVILVNAHDYYKEIGLAAILAKCTQPCILMDLPHLFADEHHLFKNVIYWHL